MEEKELLLFVYHQWSIDRILSYIEEYCRDSFHEPVTSVFTSISKAVEHIYWADLTWFNRLQGINQQPVTSFNSVTEAIIAFQKLHDTLYVFLKDDQPKRRITYKNSSGKSFENTIEEVLTHLVNHGTYHKGNITAMLWALGHKSTATDYIVFLRETKMSGA